MKKENKFVANFLKYKSSYILTGLIAFVVGVAIFLTVFLINESTLRSALDGVTVAFVSLLAFGGLVIVSSYGMFDSFSYGFNQMFASFFNKKANKYNDYNSYVEGKKEKRANSANIQYSFVFVSILFGVSMVILLIIYNVK